MYQIEKILKSHNRKNKRQLLVLWLGYHSEKDFYATFISYVSDPFNDDFVMMILFLYSSYDDFYWSDFEQKSTPQSNSRESMKLVVFLKINVKSWEKIVHMI